MPYSLRPVFNGDATATTEELREMRTKIEEYKLQYPPRKLRVCERCADGESPEVERFFVQEEFSLRQIPWSTLMELLGVDFGYEGGIPPEFWDVHEVSASHVPARKVSATDFCPICGGILADDYRDFAMPQVRHVHEIGEDLPEPARRKAVRNLIQRGNIAGAAALASGLHYSDGSAVYYLLKAADVLMIAAASCLVTGLPQSERPYIEEKVDAAQRYIGMVGKSLQALDMED